MIFEHLGYLSIVDLVGFLTNLIEVTSFRLCYNSICIFRKEISPKLLVFLHYSFDRLLISLLLQAKIEKYYLYFVRFFPFIDLKLLFHNAIIMYQCLGAVT